MSEEPIDFVITWVDGNNPEWKELKQKYLTNDDKFDSRARRYRDWNNLRYLLRGIEKNASWANHIYLVTPGHFPSWLNTENGKITVINQNDIVDEQYVPTFNNCAVELFLHKIPGLAENFVYMNDDMFIINKVSPSDYFFDGLPRDTVGLCPNQAIYSADGKGVYGIAVMNTRLVAKHFNKAEVLHNSGAKLLDLRNGSDLIKTIFMIPFNGLTGFSDVHTAYSYKKSTFKEVWEKAENDLRETCKYRFRGEFNVAHWCMRYWQICSGKFNVRSRRFSEFFDIHEFKDANKAVICINKRKKKMICINDNIDNDEQFEEIKDSINDAFLNIFPQKCSFEKEEKRS